MSEDDLRTSLQDGVEDASAAQPSVADLIAQGTRRRRRRNATRMSVAAVLTVAVATATAIGVNASTGRDPGVAPVSAPPGRPAPTLAPALSSTTSTSFRYQSDLVQRRSPDDPHLVKTRCTGAIDPATQSGYSKSGMTEHWVVNGMRYLKMGNARSVIGKGDAAEFLTCSGTTTGQGLLSADPLTLLYNLKDVSSVDQSGSEENAKYTFRSPVLTGTFTVRGGRVSSMTLHIDSPKSGDTPALRRDVTMTLSDYGVPVSQKAPW
jgi:hypothetical protein